VRSSESPTGKLFAMYVKFSAQSHRSRDQSSRHNSSVTDDLLQLHFGGIVFPANRSHDNRLRADHLETLVQQTPGRGASIGGENARSRQEAGTYIRLCIDFHERLTLCANSKPYPTRTRLNSLFGYSSVYTRSRLDSNQSASVSIL
jgi:hypothetical protein